MEKIKERDFKLLWLPDLLAVLSFVLCYIFLFLGFVVPPLFVIASILLIVPIGCFIFARVYWLYFYYQLSLDIDAVCEGDGVESKSYLYVLALNTITFGIYGKYWIYKVAQRLQTNAPRYGFKMIIGGKEMLVLDLFSIGWISKWEFVRNMNRIAKVYNQTGLAEKVGGVQ